MIRFTPFDESELVPQPFVPGKYKFKVLDVEEKSSSTGKNMISTKLQVYTNDNRDFISYDNLFPDNVAWRFYRFLKAVGLGEQYKSGEISIDSIINKFGTADFQYEEYNGRKRLKPKDYLFFEVDAEQEVAAQFKDDDIPF